MIKRILQLSAITAALLFSTIFGLYGYFLYTPAIDEPVLPGSFTRHTLTYDGIQRSYALYRPSQNSDNAPLLLVLHGSKGSGDSIRKQTAYEFDLLAEQYGVLVAYPDGFENHWNDCRESASYSANTLGIDDTGFLTQLAEHLAGQYPTDLDRVFVTGFSNGGHMAFRLALEAPQRVAGIAAIAANLPVEGNLGCIPSGQPVSVALFNGTDDPINPYQGGLVKIGNDSSRGAVRSTDDSIRYWLELAHIDQAGQRHEHLDHDDNTATRVVEQRWQNSDGVSLRLYTLQGSGHVIPSRLARFPRILGEPAADISAPAEILRFFLATEHQPRSLGR